MQTCGVFFPNSSPFLSDASNFEMMLRRKWHGFPPRRGPGFESWNILMDCLEFEAQICIKWGKEKVITPWLQRTGCMWRKPQSQTSRVCHAKIQVRFSPCPKFQHRLAISSLPLSKNGNFSIVLVGLSTSSKVLIKQTEPSDRGMFWTKKLS